MREIELRRKMKATVVPTNDADVRRMLRQLGEPVTLFGEREVRCRACRAGMGTTAVGTACSTAWQAWLARHGSSTAGHRTPAAHRTAWPPSPAHPAPHHPCPLPRWSGGTACASCWRIWARRRRWRRWGRPPTRRWRRRRRRWRCPQPRCFTRRAPPPWRPRGRTSHSSACGERRCGWQRRGGRGRAPTRTRRPRWRPRSGSCASWPQLRQGCCWRLIPRHPATPTRPCAGVGDWRRAAHRGLRLLPRRRPAGHRRVERHRQGVGHALAAEAADHQGARGARDGRGVAPRGLHHGCGRGAVGGACWCGSAAGVPRLAAAC